MCFWIFKKKQAAGTKVSFVKDNVAKCVCPKCPVQAKSKCVADKVAVITQALGKSPLKREDIPGLYCASGTATCKDLDPKQACICATCPVWAELKLASGKPQGYFCRDGAAK